MKEQKHLQVHVQDSYEDKQHFKLGPVLEERDKWLEGGINNKGIPEI